MELITERPQWFKDALEVEHKSSKVNINGADIHFLEWGDPQNQSVIMLHGNHLHPAVTLLFTCVACVLIGCGKSTEPQGPKPGALQSYLEQNPELNEDNDQGVDSEDEFGEGDGDS